MAEKMVIVPGSGNIVNVAEYMSNMTNTVNNNLAKSNVDDSVNDLIKQLTGHLERIAPEIEPSQLKKMGKNLERLSDETASDEPERGWYEISLKGLKEAAQAVGAIAQPIIGILEKMTMLLLK